MVDETDPWADLVVAMLSVNSFPLDRSYQYFGGLEDEGMAEPVGQDNIIFYLGGGAHPRPSSVGV